MDPYSCALARIWLAYVDWGLLDVTCHDIIVVSNPSVLNVLIRVIGNDCGSFNKKEFGTNSIIVLMFVESQKVHI